MDKLPLNWFDLVVVIVLLLGLQRGRKRGMSEECLTMTKWLVLVVVCAFAYQPMGRWVASVSPFSMLFSYIISYVLVALVVAGAFAFLQRSLGGKLIGSDIFGSAEYYLAMPSGMLRFACVLLAALALLNARLYRVEEVKSMQRFQMDNYGSEFFPTLQTVQAQVFERSLLGPQIRKYMSFLLITPTRPENKELQRAQEKKLP